MLAVVPHKKCLAKLEPSVTYLRGGEDKPVGRNTRSVGSVGIKDQTYTERYKVKSGFMKEILRYFPDRPEIDAFADQKNHHFADWWGPGGGVPMLSSKVGEVAS
jgi:hypothetical protein